MHISNPFRLTLYLYLYIMIPSVSQAATFVVNSTGDSHDVVPGDKVAGDHVDPDFSFCTLRAAIEESNALPGPDTIIIPGDVSPIKLCLGSLWLEDDSTCIVGSSGLPIIDGAYNPRYSTIMTVVSNNNRISGLILHRSRGHSIFIQGADNLIGGDAHNDINIFINNGLDDTTSAAVTIAGLSATHNVLMGNHIGLRADGSTVGSNRNGVLIQNEAAYNTVGGTREDGNLISSNERYAVVISSSAHHNKVSGNVIGLDITGITTAGNGLGGILITDRACENIVGGDKEQEGNLISANEGNAITISGWNVRANTVKANVIGLDYTGRIIRGNHGNGIALLDGARENEIGVATAEAGNIIACNWSSGIHISGLQTDYNLVVNNLIGLNARGIASMPNGTVNGDGILIDSGARYNVIGGSTLIEANAISGNTRYGVHIDGVGTGFNRVTGNYIGINVYGSSSVPNSAGVVISDGAQFNTVGGENDGEGNTISGNRDDLFPYGAGVLICNDGTDNNTVLGNLIGTDVSGTRALRNGSAGVIIGDGAQKNIIGGTTPGARNVISGNGVGEVVPGMGRGVHIFGYLTMYNKVLGNYIGTTADGVGELSNSGNGIGLYAGACDNHIGGHSREAGNMIYGNEMHGVYVSGCDTRSNLIRYNRIIENDSLGIAVRCYAQNNVLPPVIIEATTNYVTGTGALPGGVVDVYIAAPDPSSCGEALTHVGSGVADDDGNYRVSVSGVGSCDTLTAMATDVDNNSSEFSVNMVVGGFTSVDDEETTLPFKFSLSQNYPNPFNPLTQITYCVSRKSYTSLVIYNSLGQVVRTLVSEIQPAGKYDVIWDGMTDRSDQAASGIYLYRLQTESRIANRKMILLK